MIKRIITIVFLSTLLSCQQHDLFDNSLVVVKKIPVNYGGELDTIYILRSFSNAATNESIQVRTTTTLSSLNALFFFERYEIMEDYILERDSIRLMLRDTNKFIPSIDTFDLAYKDIF